MKPISTLALLALTAACSGAQEPSSSSNGDPEGASAGDPVISVNTDENYDCRGTVRGTFANVFVPEGATCRLQRSVVNGNVLARDGSRLYVTDTRVSGNIDGVEARGVQV